jgi:hypothetical protein
MSFKEGPDRHYVVGLQAAQVGADLYLLDCVRGQWDYHTDDHVITGLPHR